MSVVPLCFQHRCRQLSSPNLTQRIPNTLHIFQELEYCPDEQIPTMKRQQAEEMASLEDEIKTERARSLAMLEKQMSASSADLGKKQQKREEAVKDRDDPAWTQP